MSRELDALIAEKVMRLKPCNDPIGRCEAAHMTPPQCWGHGGGGRELDSYSTDIAAAWEVVERFPRFVVSKFPDWNWRCYVWPEWAEGSDQPGFVADAETGSLAICRAALLAVGVEPPENGLQ